MQGCTRVGEPLRFFEMKRFFGEQREASRLLLTMKQRGESWEGQATSLRSLFFGGAAFSGQRIPGWPGRVVRESPLFVVMATVGVRTKAPSSKDPRGLSRQLPSIWVRNRPAASDHPAVETASPVSSCTSRR